MTQWAHSANSSGTRQTLRAHLLGTARLAARFGAEFGAADAAYSAGLLHDAGKISCAWQERLMCLEAGIPAPRADHKRLGALLVAQTANSPGAFAVAGHHGGIPDKADCPRGEVDEALLRQLTAEIPEITRLLENGSCVPKTWASNPSLELIEFATRMLHSTLVDADYLDTAAHFANSEPAVRDDSDFTDLVARFENGRAAMLKERHASDLDADRKAVYDAALAASSGSPGLYRMSAPTGSGKTLAAAGFALHHAALHNLRRVVVAVPFTTITEQNAEVYRRLLGEDSVLEHHSAVEPTGVSGYGVENWDSPFVVTTTVQLFESLFSNRPAKTRKLHRLCKAVIVLDEVQALPKHLLNPILDALRVLVSHFGATVLLASATQPTFEVLDSWKRMDLTPIEIVPDPPTLYRRMARVSFEWQSGWGLDDVAQRILRERSTLTVMNTTAGARELAKQLAESTPGSTLHLSTRMCRAHRAEVLTEARRRLAADEPVHLVSTQLIEAGVDVDFPVVFRQAAPAESIIQAAGRANREGRLAAGRVVVFDGTELPSLRAYLTGSGLTDRYFRRDPSQLNSPDALRTYFGELFTLENLDESAAALQRLRRDFCFASVADAFRVIDDSTTSVLVDWAHAHEALEAELTGRILQGRDVIPTTTLRRLQPFLVDLPTRLARGEYASHLLERVPGLFVWCGPYSLLTGIGSAERSAFIF